MSGMPGGMAHKGEGHRGRLRERFLTGGLDGFLDYEVVELLLTLATPRKDCKDAAKRAMAKFKTLQGVFEADPGELLGVEGIGPKNMLGIKLIKAVADRFLAKKVVGRDAICNSGDLFAYLNSAIRDKTRECFVAVFLDSKNRVIAMQTLFEGTLTASSVYPREVVRAALQHHAAALIFAHNHPSGRFAGARASQAEGRARGAWPCQQDGAANPRRRPLPEVRHCSGAAAIAAVVRENGTIGEAGCRSRKIRRYQVRPGPLHENLP